MESKNNASSISLATIGGKLKSAREKKGVTIDQAQRQTHIHSTVLLALEEGRSDEILTPTYVKSFLRKYSSYLDLDSNQLLKEYLTLHPNLDSPGSSLGLNGASINKRINISGAFRIVRNICLIAVAIFLLAAMVRGAVRFIKASHKPSAGKAYTQSKQSHAKIADKKTADKPVVSQVSIPDNEPITLMMRVKEPVYVGVKSDGVLLFKRTVPKGTIETVTAEKKLNVSIAKARSVELFLNGRPLGAVGKGAIKDLEITRKGIKVQ